MSEHHRSEHPVSEHHGGDHHEPTNYVKIWAILVVLLIVSVLGPLLGIKVVTLITAFGIAVVKAGLVVKHFMHLNMEKPIIKWMLAATVVLMALLWGGVAPDVQNHEGRLWVNQAAQAAVVRGIAEPAHAEDEEHAAETATVAAQETAPDPGFTQPRNLLPGGYTFTHVIFWMVVGLIAIGTNAVPIILSVGAGLLTFETIRGDKEQGA